MANRTRAAQMFRPETYFRVLGVQVNALQIPDVITRMEEWIRGRGQCHSIAATGMHGIVEAQQDTSFKEILNASDLIVPDGMPLIWLGRRRGHHLARRVYGPDLLLAFCEKTKSRGYRHFFYGGEPGVAERLAESLTTRCPGLNAVGMYSPPFRPLSANEDAEMVEMIGRAAPKAEASATLDEGTWIGMELPIGARAGTVVATLFGVWGTIRRLCGDGELGPEEV